MNTIFHKEIISYNKELYNRHNMDESDAFFEDTIYAEKERTKVYKKAFIIKKTNGKGLLLNLSEHTIIISLIKHINKLLRSLDKLAQVAFNLNIDPETDLKSIKEVLTSNHSSYKGLLIDETKSSITDDSIIHR